ncbi:EcsC family protein [Terrabacter sp. Root181]|uniref:EcsC family protein n=1 Tax=Terrabacter sp. Root181 TaxID=1736484 RepID=UPI0009E7F49F|nr:EcsC family protein [Terrabacter sp. Root181]
MGWDRDETVEASDATAVQLRTAKDAGALERAALPAEGGLSGAATRLVERLLDVGIDGKGPFDPAHEIAANVLKHARGDADEALRIIARDHRQLGAVGGFVTGLGGFFLMPLSLPANVLEFYLLATRMTAATAKVRGYDIDQPEIRSAILLTLAGADSEDILKKAGLHAAGGKLSAVAFDRLPAPALMVLNKAVGFRLLGRIGQGTFARLGRLVPFVGGLVGAAVDVYMLNRIGKQAAKEFPPVATFGR